MPNHAVVIGIDRYWTDLASLTGAVADAQDFASWLVESGEVPSANVALCLVPGLESPPVPSLLAACPRSGASLDDLNELLTDFLDAPKVERERFFFFFSGHGASSSNPVYAEEAICLDGFNERAWHKALEVSSLLSVLNAIPARERFILIDGCRNRVFSDDIRFGTLARQPRPAPGQRRNYVLRATAPGRKAAEVAGRGLFARHLCAGLGGAGTAKRWDPDAAEGDGGYCVRWRALGEYVAGEVGMLDEAKRYEQLVYLGGEHPANEDPLLAYYPANHFQLSRITVRLSEPEQPPAYAVICARRNDSDEVETCLAISPLRSVEFDVPPSAWVVWARAPGWRSRPRAKPLLAYADRLEEEIALLPEQPPAKLQDRTAPSPADTPPISFEIDFGEGGGATAFGIDSGGGLRIRVSGKVPAELHPQVRVTLQKESGEIVVDPLLEDEIELAPGIYRVRLETAGGSWIEELVLIGADEVETLDLKLPNTATPALVQTLSAGNKPPPQDGFAMPSESLGPLVAPSIATVSAFAVGQAVQGYQWGLAGLGIGKRWLSENQIGVEVVIADDRSLARDRAKSRGTATRAHLWRMEIAGRLTAAKIEATNAAVPLRSASLTAAPGGYWLQLKETDSRRRGGSQLATYVFEGHVTIVVRHQLPAGTVALFQFGVPRNPDRRAEILLGLANAEALQRARATGRDPLADPVLIALAEGRWFEPISALVSAAAVLDRGSDGQALFEAIVTGLESHGISGPDMEVLRAARAGRAGNDNAVSLHVLGALNAAEAPLVDRLLERLDSEAKRLRVLNSKRGWVEELLSQSLGHPLWTLLREDDKVRGGR